MRRKCYVTFLPQGIVRGGHNGGGCNTAGRLVCRTGAPKATPLPHNNNPALQTKHLPNHNHKSNLSDDNHDDYDNHNDKHCFGYRDYGDD